MNQELVFLGFIGTVVCFFVAFVFQKYAPPTPISLFGVFGATVCTMMFLMGLLYQKLLGCPSLYLLIIKPGWTIVFLVYFFSFGKIACR